jgi:hypothetical protein
MKTFIRLLLAGIIFTVSQGISRADAGYSFSFTTKQGHEGGTKKERFGETVKNQKWSYTVTIENKSFKDVSDIEIKYVVFSKQSALGDAVVIGHEDLQRHDGGTTIKLLKNNDQVSFTTDGIMLTSVQFNDGYDYYGTGAKGALRGLWLRVYVGGQMVSEYMDPPNLSSKQTFEPPPKD